MTTDELFQKVRSAWSEIPPPPPGDLSSLELEFGAASATLFIGVPPVDVDISSGGFLGCTPLLLIKPRASAVYLGSYLLSLLDGLTIQKKTGMFADILTRAHVLHCLQQERFWKLALSPNLPPKCRNILIDVAWHIDTNREFLALTSDETAKISRFARDLAGKIPEK